MRPCNIDDRCIECSTPTLKLAEVCEAIASGRTDQVQELFKIAADEAMPADLRRLAEAFGLLVVQVEGRDFHVDQLIADLKQSRHPQKDDCSVPVLSSLT